MKNIIICSDGTWRSLNPAFSYSVKESRVRDLSRETALSYTSSNHNGYFDAILQSG